MKITIHRGTNQIGGCVTEIESDGYRVFIDFGEQLPGTPVNNLPSVDGLTCGDVSKSALFISHYHGDHIGKITETMSDLPIYAGKTALNIFNCLENKLSHIPYPTEAAKHIQTVNLIKSINAFTALQKIQIGNITVTPLFVDHSAFDSYMFVIEAENLRILHTGDFRGHGFRSKGLIPTLKKYSPDIDYIISEGTNILRSNSAVQTEQELQSEFQKQFKENKFNFVLVSSTNIDRIFALYHAAKKARRCFVCDSYQAKILKLVSKDHQQMSSFYNIDYDQTTNYVGRFFSLRRVAPNPFSFRGKLKDYLEKRGFCMLIRSNDAFLPLLNEYAPKKESKIYYSMWNGYLVKGKPAYNPSLDIFLNSFNYDIMHTSGHADVSTLQTVFNTVNPKEGIIPIHTEAPDKFNNLFGTQFKIISLNDGELFDCNTKSVIV